MAIASNSSVGRYSSNEKGKSLLNVLQGHAFPKIDFLTFEGLDKAFNKDIAIRIFSTSHVDLQMMILQHLDILPRDKLTPLIGVMDTTIPFVQKIYCLPRTIK